MLKVRRTRSQMQSKLLDNISNETGSFYGHWTIKDLERALNMNMCYHDSLDWRAAGVFISVTGFRTAPLVTPCLPPLPFVAHALLTFLAPIYRSCLCYIEFRSRPGKARFAFSLSPWTQCQNSRSG